MPDLMLTRQIHPRELAGIDAKKALEKLSAKKEGLDASERDNRRVRFGKNRLPEKKDTSIIVRFLKEFSSPFVFLLLGVACISIYMREWGDAIIISAVLVMNAVIGTFQSARASRALKALKRDVTFEARCLVNGEHLFCSVDDLVPGDVVRLQAGDRIPADGRWITVTEIRVDESSLTGESIAVSKTSDAIKLKTNAIAADIRNAGYAGTTVVAGTGLLVISAIGTESEVGHIALRLSERRPEPPLVTRVRTLSHQVLTAVIIIALILFIASVASGRPILASIPLILALIVAIVPEGLPVVLTIVLARGVRDMSKKNAIVKELQAVESLGGVDTIFTDKTGTLTLNELHFNKAVLADQTTVQIAHDGCVRVNGDEDRAKRFAELMAAVADPAANLKERLRSVDPIDRAFLDLAGAYTLEVPMQRDVRPFDGTTRTRAVTTTLKNGDTVSILAGSPEQILNACGEKNINYEAHLLTMARQGMRVIAFAESAKAQLGYSASGWKFAGLAGLRDDPKKEAKDAIKWCRSHGINVTMITGDHPETALVIAKEVGLASKRSSVRLGEDLMRMNDDQLVEELKEVRVIARATPETKMRLIEVARGEQKIIAMTGDGVNDAPALHAADVGVAMGGTGTDVAREAADLVLMDDNFATIVDAIKEGRSVLGNVQKVVTYLFATNAMELAVIGVALAFMLPTPLLAVQILWLNLVTDALPVLALATEPAHGGQTKPEHGKLLPKNAWIRIGILGTAMGAIGLGAYFYAMSIDGDMMRFSIVLLAMTSMQWWAAFSIRSSTRSVFTFNPFENTFLLAAIGIIIVMTLIALSGGPLSHLLHVTSIPWTVWLWIIALGALVLLPDEIWKLVHARKRLK